MEFFGSVMEDAIPIILKWSLAIWAVIEIIFYFCITWILVPMLQPRKAPQKSMFKNPVEMMRDIYNLLESVASYSFDQFCSGFSLYSHIDDIHTENFDSFLSWAVFTSHFHDLTEFQKETIRDLRIEALQKFDMNMKEGHNISVKHAKFNLERIYHYHRPLIIYIIFYLIELSFILFYLYKHEFKKYSLNNIVYWYHKNKSISTSTLNKPPILILHGICSGWSYYSQLIEILRIDRDIILIDYNCIKMNSLCFHVPDAIEFNIFISLMLKNHSLDKVSIISHSWGTFLAGWIIKINPQFISHLTLIDPISLTVFLPETTYAILYKPPRNILDYLLCFFVRNDLNIANTLFRNFVWYNMYLSLEDIPHNIPMLIALGGNDDMISAPCANEMIDKYISKRKNENSKKYEKKINLNKENRTSTATSTSSVVKLFWKDLAHGEAINNKNTVFAIKKVLDENENFLFDF